MIGEKANDNEEINLLINDFFFYTRLKFSKCNGKKFC